MRVKAFRKGRCSVSFDRGVLLDGRSRLTVQAEGLSFRYGKERIWHDVSFALSEGEVAFLVGENGSGKSTLLRCLGGWSTPAEGRLYIGGEVFDGADMRFRKEIAYVGDTPSFYDDLTAGEHLRFIDGAGGFARQPKGELDLLIESFGLSAHLNQVPSSYSRGMRQKLALAIAFASHARVLLFDEPHGPLDPQAAEVFCQWVKKAAAEGATVVMSCHHDLPDLSPDVVLCLKGGVLTETRDDSRGPSGEEPAL